MIRPRRAVRARGSNRYNYGPYRGGFYSSPYRYRLGSLLGLGFVGYLGWNCWNHYAYDPFYCNYYVGYGYNHFHWRANWAHPLNYSTWWYPSTYCPPSYIYINSRGDYSPYPSTVVVGEVEEPEEEKPASTEIDAPASTETLIKRHVTLGDYYFKEGRYKDASESYLRAMAYAPEDASIHFVLADALFALGDYHYAAFVIRKGVRLDPTMVYAEADKRTFYADPKDFDKHMETILSYVKEKPFDVAAHLVLGYNFKFSDRKAQAIKAFERVLEISPEHESAKLFLEALRPPVEEMPEVSPTDIPGSGAPVKKSAETPTPTAKGTGKPGDKPPVEKTTKKNH